MAVAALGLSNPNPVVLGHDQLSTRQDKEQVDPAVTEIFGKLAINKRPTTLIATSRVHE